MPPGSARLGFYLYGLLAPLCAYPPRFSVTLRLLRDATLLTPPRKTPCACGATAFSSAGFAVRLLRSSPRFFLTYPAGTPRRSRRRKLWITRFHALRESSLPPLRLLFPTRPAAEPLGSCGGPGGGAARHGSLTYPAGTPRRAAPCPPGTRGRRRRRWRCGSFCRRSPAGPRRPRSHRRPQW